MNLLELSVKGLVVVELLGVMTELVDIWIHMCCVHIHIYLQVHWENQSKMGGFCQGQHLDSDVAL
jgi:hypothetical protein